MDLDELAKIIDKETEDVLLAEIHIITRDDNGRIFRKTVTIDYADEDDYQWSTSTKMLG